MKSLNDVDLVDCVLERRLSRPDGEFEVWAARHPQLNRVALKRVRPDLNHREDLAERLDREDAILRRIDCPGIVHSYARSAHPLVLILEYCDGDSLLKRIDPDGTGGRVERLTSIDALNLFMRIAAAVECVHAHGVIHRDIKPSNILFAGSEIRLIDFGIAFDRHAPTAFADEWEELRLGTIPYAAPELLRMPAIATNACVDVFALGVVLYELLTGRLPFAPMSGETEDAYLDRIAERQASPPSWYGDAVSPALDQVVLAAIASAPDQRPASVRELIDGIEAAGAGTRDTPHTWGPPAVSARTAQ